MRIFCIAQNKQPQKIIITPLRNGNMVKYEHNRDQKSSIKVKPTWKRATFPSVPQYATRPD